MKKFHKLSVLNVLNLPLFAQDKIREYSKSEVIFPNHDSESEEETIKIIGDSDAVLGSWNTTITAKVLDACPKLKYIGICGTSMSKIDVAEVIKRGIVIKNVTDYGDEAVGEFIFAQLLMLFRGYGKYKWSEPTSELNGKKIGIVGLGAVGRIVADLALGFKMSVSYHSKTRNQLYEEKGVKYCALDTILTDSDIISLHVPRDIMILSSDKFNLISQKVALVNTCIGSVMDLDAFNKWISTNSSYAIFDNQDYLSEIINLPRVIAPTDHAAHTQESITRLSQKAIDNIESFLEQSTKT